MLFLSALVLGGSIVYLVNDQAGSVMIAAGCALALVDWISKHLIKRS